jgi:hypothetical protein
VVFSGIEQLKARDRDMTSNILVCRAVCAYAGTKKMKTTANIDTPKELRVIPRQV